MNTQSSDKRSFNIVSKPISKSISKFTCKSSGSILSGFSKRLIISALSILASILLSAYSPAQGYDMIPFVPEKSHDYCMNPVCRYICSPELVTFRFSFGNSIPITDDDQVYLFEISTFEDSNDLSGKEPIAKTVKSSRPVFAIPFKERYLFSDFVPALLYQGEYVPISNGLYIMNPDSLAFNKDTYPETGSKKGILLDANTLGTELLSNLNVNRIAFNIPLSFIMGPSDNDLIPTVNFEYNGKTYEFNGYHLKAFDSMFKFLTENGYYTTAIVLNDWNEEYPEMIHPLSMGKNHGSMYYAFNTESEAGVRTMEAVALFLANRYSGNEYGMVHDWVIANEVNQQKIWNYMATADLPMYTASFEKSFRTFYNAIRSSYANANVYFSVDNSWNNNGGNNARYFNARDFIYEFNDIANRCGSYDWGLSIHPYSYPLTTVKFWDKDYDKSEYAKVITPMNLSSVTEIMEKDEFKNADGNVRDIAVTEIGFTSRNSEELQAAAFAYSYYIIEDNDHITSYLLNRQTDDTESLKSGLSLGIYNNDYSSKIIKDVFANIDSEAGDEYIPEMLKIIGEDSLEAAIKKAR